MIKSARVYQLLNTEIEDFASSNIDFKTSDMFRLWVANRKLIQSWDNNSYDTFVIESFNIINNIVSNIDSVHPISQEALYTLKTYQEEKTLRK
ncbi:hypothetical protein SHAM105786_15940 [Shewanella amazonensis]|uniref:Uncharacterized protein n=1 Tax=Shewanella amazonensis (strain ATCC BAA-1098 / SB2B) TaxID=326297 RepID=A1S2B9_SHEAM|nr:hypothetical protein [Shewanella amazonensis]ABL98525.1 hypothetical protein Sama_0314 [Shewanella amazonensis SB2B]